MSAKKYLSKKWLERRLLVDKKTPEQIADECSVTRVTIYRQIGKFKIIMKR